MQIQITQLDFYTFEKIHFIRNYLHLCAVCQRVFNTLQTFVCESVSESRIPLSRPCHCQKIYEVVLVTKNCCDFTTLISTWDADVFSFGSFSRYALGDANMQDEAARSSESELAVHYMLQTIICHCSSWLTMHCVVPQNKSNIRMRAQCPWQGYNLLIKKYHDAKVAKTTARSSGV